MAMGGFSMQHTTRGKVLGLGFLALLVCLPTRAQQQNSQQSGSGDPVAEAARKAKEQKKDAPKPKKVYTEDDLVTNKSDISVVGPAPVQTDASTAAQTAAKTGAGGKEKEKEDPNSEKAWRKRFDDLRTKITTAERELAILEREQSKADLQYYPDPTKAMKEQYSRDEINKKAAKIDAKQKEIAALKQQWDNLEDQLRKAGGNPGWAR